MGQATHAQPVAPGASTLCPFRKIDKIRLLGFTTLHDTRRYDLRTQFRNDICVMSFFFLRPPSLSYFDLVPGKVRPTVLNSSSTFQELRGPALEEAQLRSSDATRVRERTLYTRVIRPVTASWAQQVWPWRARPAAHPSPRADRRDRPPSTALLLVGVITG